MIFSFLLLIGFLERFWNFMLLTWMCFVAMFEVCILNVTQRLNDLWFGPLNSVLWKFYLIFEVAFVSCMLFVFEHEMKPSKKEEKNWIKACFIHKMWSWTHDLPRLHYAFCDHFNHKCSKVQMSKGPKLQICFRCILCAMHIRTHSSFHVHFYFFLTFNSIQPKANNILIWVV